MVKADYERALLALADIDCVVMDNNLRKIENDFPANKGALLPIKAVADYLGVTVKALTCDKNFPIKKISGRNYVSRIALARYLV